MTSLVLLLTACIVKNFGKKAKEYFIKPHQSLKAGKKARKFRYNLFMKTILFLLVAACFALAACSVENPVITAENQNIINENPPSPPDKTPVLVELFTSEG
jgi:large-conductance mechanosensitive channel